MQYEAFLDALRAAARVKTEESCEFEPDHKEECTNEAVWLIEYRAKDGPMGLLICDSCSNRGWIYARENELDFHEVSQQTKDAFGDRVDRFVPYEEYLEPSTVERYETYFADKACWVESDL